MYHQRRLWYHDSLNLYKYIVDHLILRLLIKLLFET